MGQFSSAMYRHKLCQGTELGPLCAQGKAETQGTELLLQAHLAPTTDVFSLIK